jgi:hypothetical protein
LENGRVEEEEEEDIDIDGEFIVDREQLGLNSLVFEMDKLLQGCR